MKIIQVLLFVLSMIVIVIGAIIINTHTVWARPAACDCVCDCDNWTWEEKENAHCMAGPIYGYPCGRLDPYKSCAEWCPVP